ncbi:MAG: 2-oxo acid dehydrogenase subunit E2 [Anaerolineae bacterium]
MDGAAAAHDARPTLSFDHDIVDGAPAARFARRFVQLVEEAYGIAPS